MLFACQFGHFHFHDGNNGHFAVRKAPIGPITVMPHYAGERVFLFRRILDERNFALADDALKPKE